jgi:hypothetical protein
MCPVAARTTGAIRGRSQPDKGNVDDPPHAGHVIEGVSRSQSRQSRACSSGSPMASSSAGVWIVRRPAPGVRVREQVPRQVPGRRGTPRVGSHLNRPDRLRRGRRAWPPAGRHWIGPDRTDPGTTERQWSQEGRSVRDLRLAPATSPGCWWRITSEHSAQPCEDPYITRWCGPRPRGEELQIRRIAQIGRRRLLRGCPYQQDRAVCRRVFVRVEAQRGTSSIGQSCPGTAQAGVLPGHRAVIVSTHRAPHHARGSGEPATTARW